MEQHTGHAAGGQPTRTPATEDAYRRRGEALLRAWAAAEESLRAGEAEARAWAATMRDLNARRLPYEEWVSERQAALEDRLRGRKLQQTRIRYRYGFKQPRRWRLIARDVRALCQQASVSMRDARVP